MPTTRPRLGRVLLVLIAGAVLAMALVSCGGRGAKIRGDEASAGSRNGRLGQPPPKKPHGVRAYMDRLAGALADATDVEIQRVGDEIKMTWAGSELFDMDSAMLSQASRVSLRRVADVLAQYAETRISIAGYASDRGEPEYSQKLSERRAQSLATFLSAMGVDASRIEAMGYGSTEALPGVGSDGGSAPHPGIEITIRAGDALGTTPR